MGKITSQVLEWLWVEMSRSGRHHRQRPGAMRQPDQLRKLNTVASVVELKSFWEVAGDKAGKLGMTLERL